MVTINRSWSRRRACRNKGSCEVVEVGMESPRPGEDRDDTDSGVLLDGVSARRATPPNHHIPSSSEMGDTVGH